VEIQDRVFIVTGGASGLGKGVVEAALARGAKIGVFDMNGAAGMTMKRLGSVVFQRVDVADEASVTQGIAEVVEAFGRIDVCVCCAGIGLAGKTYGRKGPLPLADFKRVIDVNLSGTFNVLRLAVAEMAKNEPDARTGERGAIVTTSSGAAYDGQVGQAAYSASKAGVIGMLLPIARDLAQVGVRINDISPGPFDTGMMQGLSEALRQSLIDQTEFPKRLGMPSEFAALALHMVENPFLNGESVRLDAATRMRPR
jgi:NAD(P)-dependent dehydrogenase (short-subunit alcohol dehydrogenase family)